MHRLNIVLSQEAAEIVETYSAEVGASQTAWLRQAIALFYVCHKAKCSGKHVGLVDDASKLDTMIVGLH